MSQYVNTTSDNGGVHINSGIPNRAFYLAAVALGGYSWQKAGRIWYATLCDSRLQPTAQFQDFANLTVDNAAKLLGAAEAQAVADAWREVGIVVALGTGKVSGNWVLHFSWGPTNTYTQSNITFNTNGTFGGAATGKWQQQDGTILLSFDTGPAKYGGNIGGNIGSGAMSTFGGLDGCWYLTKQGTTGIALEAGDSSHDVAGNPMGVTDRAHEPEELDASGNPVGEAMHMHKSQAFDAAGNSLR
jgi:thermolysin metallopeptidase-like protein